MDLDECVGTLVPIEPVEDGNKGGSVNSSAIVVVILAVVAAAWVGVYFFKFKKPKTDKGTHDLDDYDFWDEDNSDETEIDESEDEEADEKTDTEADEEGEDL